MITREIVRTRGAYTIERVVDTGDGYEYFDVIDDWGNPVEKVPTLSEAEAVMNFFAED
ncbi:MAG: hypothetical protein KDG50_10790 [Chromatiales bacterium]|nr:hypothetical protein [Chromatiales bacterium]